MKLMFAAVALAALIPAAAQAQETRTEERRVIVMGGPGGHMEIGEDGLSRDAFLARHTEMFDRLDADHNGVVSREEMSAMAAMHGGGHGPGHAGWTSEDGERIVIRRAGPGGEPMVIDGETIDVEGGADGERRIIIRRRSPDGETVDVVEGGQGAHGGGERQIMVFRHEGEGGLDADGDGRWSFEEMTAPLREHFNQLDANHDGFVDAGERDR